MTGNCERIMPDILRGVSSAEMVYGPGKTTLILSEPLFKELSWEYKSKVNPKGVDGIPMLFGCPVKVIQETDKQRCYICVNTIE